MTYFEAYNKAQAIGRKFSEQLQEYGYKDVFFDKYPCKTESGDYRLSNSIHLYFWDETYGYMLSVYDINEQRKTDEAYNFDAFITICEKILSFVKNTSVLECDYTEAFGEHLKQLGIYAEKSGLSWISDEYANVFFHNSQFHIHLNQRNVNATLTIKPDNDYDEDIPDKPDEETYSYIKSEIDKSILVGKLGNEYTYNTVFEWDCLLVSIYNQTHVYSLFIKFSLDYGELGYQIKEIVDCFVSQIRNNTTNLLSDLEDCDFHIHNRCDDGFTAIVCEKLDVFTIVAWVEKPDSGSKKISLLCSKTSFDNMRGREFELFCAKLLLHNGFVNVTLTQSSGDQGVDIIAYKDSIKYGIQCKCYTADVGNKAVQEVLAGRTFYNCDVGVVLTNSYFTKAAVALAQKSRIHLWDRDKLLQMVDAMNKA